MKLHLILASVLLAGLASSCLAQDSVALPVEFRIYKTRTHVFEQFQAPSGQLWDHWYVAGTLDSQIRNCPGNGCPDMLVAIMGQAKTVFVRPNADGRFGGVASVKTGGQRPLVLVLDEATGYTWSEPGSSPHQLSEDFWARAEGLELEPGGVLFPDFADQGRIYSTGSFGQRRN